MNSETICFGDTTILSVVSSEAGGNYFWNPGTYGSIAQVWPDSTTQYSIVHELNGCYSDTAFSIVTLNYIPGIYAGADQSLCFGGSTQLTASGANSYQWLPGGQTTQTINVSPNDTTEYIVIGYISGCSGRDTVVVNIAPVLTLVASSQDANCANVCNGELMVIPLGGTAPYSYEWNQGQYLTPNITTACGGYYTIEVTDNIGCTADTTVFVFQPSQILVQSTQVNVTCKSGCDGEASVGVSGGMPGYSYSWNTLPATVAFGGNSNVVSNLCAGNYRVTVTDQNNCTTQADFYITEPDSVIVPSAPDTTICIGGSATLTAYPIQGTPNYNYTWGNGDITQSINVSPLTTTSYTVVAIDANNCSSAPQTFTVIVNPPLAVTATGLDSICLGDNVPLSAIASGGNGGPYTYTWSSPVAGGFVGNPYVFSPFDTTTYTVTVTDFCTTLDATDNHTVNVIPLPQPDFITDKTQDCTPACVLFTDNSSAVSGTISSYLWSIGDTNNIGVISNGSFTHCYESPGSYDISLSVVTDKGCKNSILLPGYITSNPVPEAYFVSTPNQTTTSDPIIVFRDSSIAASYWNWDFGDGSDSSNLSNTFHMYNDTGMFLVTLTVKNQYDCISIASDYVTITQSLHVFIPNAFAPNGIYNPLFNLKGIGISPNGFELMIFDRWGGIIYSTTDLEQGWDGKTKAGVLAKNDVYVYLIKLKDLSGKTHEYKGHVTLVN